MFMGTTYNSIDEKNRMIVPSKLRAELGSRCILTKSIDKCLTIYTEDDWKRQTDKIIALPSSDPKVRAFVRHFSGNAVECEFDKQGRIVIPQTLRDYAEIKKELVTIGAIDRIEVWSRNIWEAPDNEEKMDSTTFEQALIEYNF